ncbi:MAG: sulfatase-like hydrolase/transferase [Lentisphaeraceae bacterium]|nr:sulfatase-like hydrolase/transferase [Lentisphaeraceae bacterium]
MKYSILISIYLLVSTFGQDLKQNLPNIVLIMADDLGYGSLSCYGSDWIQTPNIDKLAANGVKFTDFHSNGPMCTPTRAALLTGRYQQRCKWVKAEELSPIFQKQRQANVKQRWAWGISLEELTIAEVLKSKGYKTALLGKWHLGYDFKFHPQNQGFDEFRGFIAGAVDYHTHISTSGMKKLDWWKGKVIENEEGYATDLLTTYAVNYIKENQRNPFFLYLTHGAPHTPIQGRNLSKKKSKAETYKEMIEVLDESVGKIVQTLKETSLEKNTLVIFCSDNGAQLFGSLKQNGKWQGTKGSMFEGGHRVPAIMSFPGKIPVGTIINKPAMSMDLFPTFLELSQASLPRNHLLDGHSLWPQICGKEENPSRNLHWLFGSKWAVRQGSWKLIGKGKQATTLVNLDDDPQEKSNLLKNHPERTKTLSELHRQWIKSVGNR